MSPFQPEHLLSILASFGAARRCWVAYSGGMDSEVLVHAVAAVRDRLAPEVRAVHVDHGLNADASRWAERCRERCRRLGVPLQVMRVDVAVVRGESLEASARIARYRAMSNLLDPEDLLLTAHHRDDQAETFLLALMRGSGLKGLAAMPQSADLGDGRLLRPLLAFSRAELRAYAESEGLDWIEDPANRDTSFNRNFLRHRVLPPLAERWPAYSVTIARSARHCAEAQQLIDAFAAQALTGLSGERPGTLSVSQLCALDAGRVRALVRHWISSHGLPVPDVPHLARVLGEVLTARADAVPLVAWPGCEVRRYRDDLFAMAPLPPKPPHGAIIWLSGALDLPQGLGRLTLRAASRLPIDPDRLWPGGARVRFRVDGLSCRPAGGRHRRSLKKLFQEHGVPSWLRCYVPLVFREDALVAVGDLWVCRNGSDDACASLHWEGGIRNHAGFQAPVSGN